MSHYLINYNRIDNEKPWVITKTNKDKTKILGSWYAADFQINTSTKPFVGKYHYLYCEGTLLWQDNKAVFNRGD